MNKLIIGIVVFLLIGLSGTTFAEDNVPERKTRLRIGFEHWYSDSFRTADTLKYLSLGLNYQLPISWIEVLLRYEWAAIKADPAQSDFLEFNGKRIDFITTGFALTKILTIESQTVALSVIPVGFLWVKVNGHEESIGGSTGFTVDWLFEGRTGILICDTKIISFNDWTARGWTGKTMSVSVSGLLHDSEAEIRYGDFTIRNNFSSD
jgi:hypothetical protein